MYSYLINNHISDIKNNLSENCILVYKGFPKNFITKISEIYPLLVPEEKIFTKDKIDLVKLKKNINDLISNFLTKDNGINTLVYEQLILLYRNINLSLFKGEIIIINNDFFEEYPNQSTIENIDIERMINEDKIDKIENEIFDEFYVNSTIKNGKNFIQYIAIDNNEFNNLKYIDFFEGLINNVNLEYDFIYEKNITEKYILYPSSDQIYSDLKYKLFFGFNIDTIFFVTDSKTIKDPLHSKEIKIFKYLSTIKEIPFFLFLKEKIYEKRYRDDFLEILRNYWHSDKFRDLIFYHDPDIDTKKVVISQGVVIEKVVQQSEKAMESNNFSDIFLTAPTGSGKSVLFQIPAIYLAKRYNLITIVISPLKALMYDQVTSLKTRGINFCAYINSDISYIEREEIIDKIKNGDISILYLSPELLLSYDWRYFIGERHIGLLVIDEAHLVTTWGRDFRVDYWFLGNYIKKIRKYSDFKFPVLAVTATAVYSGDNDIVFETIDSLNMQIPSLFIGNIRRDEISFEIRKFLFQGNHERSKIEKTIEVIINFIQNGIKAIVYFPWINQIEIVKDNLPKEYKSRIGVYYGSVDKDLKQIIMEQFRNGEILVILATKAFGMGVDISDIVAIYHHSPSGNLSDYVQEIGRVARDKALKGTAYLDFCVKDLKFTKILYGLSSIKQYQIKLALQKIADIYRYKKRLNFLVSLEDFAFIFNEKVEDVETKVKSTLLLLEKDLLKKYGYNVLIVRPKSLYSIVYAKIPFDIEKSFLSKYGEFCDLIKKNNETETKEFSGQKGNIKIIKKFDGNIYQLQLVKIWEKFFSELSFPLVKRKFFERELFIEFEDKIGPRFRLTIFLKDNKNHTLQKLQNYFEILEAALNFLQNKYFKRRELESALKQNIKDRVLRKRISDLILNLYTSHHSIGPSKNYDSFIASRIKDGEEELRIINKAFIRVRHDTIRLFNRMFLGDDSNIYQEYISIKSKNNKNYIKMAYLLESFLLGNYELSGGKLPQIFIRLGDSFKIQILSKDPKYSNEILQDVDNRHKSSMEIMERFFTSEMSNNERWDFIESYFLGRDVLA